MQSQYVLAIIICALIGLPILILRDSKKRLGKYSWGWAIFALIGMFGAMGQLGGFLEASGTFRLDVVLGYILGAYAGSFAIYRGATSRKYREQQLLREGKLSQQEVAKLVLLQKIRTARWVGWIIAGIAAAVIIRSAFSLSELGIFILLSAPFLFYGIKLIRNSNVASDEIAHQAKRAEVLKSNDGVKIREQYSRLSPQEFTNINPTDLTEDAHILYEEEARRRKKAEQRKESEAYAHKEISDVEYAETVRNHYLDMSDEDFERLIPSNLTEDARIVYEREVRRRNGLTQP